MSAAAAAAAKQRRGFGPIANLKVKLITAGIALLTALVLFAAGYVVSLADAIAKSNLFYQAENQPMYGTELLNDAVLGYLPVISEWAAKLGISEYTMVIAAMMMQESHGQGTDPMQSSECSDFNTRYPIGLNTILDPLYSIEVGVKEFHKALTSIGCENPFDTERLNVALQSYNFGPYYITWVKANHGGKWTQSNAQGFSDMMKNKLGWSSTYGDPLYVQHVRQYLSMTPGIGGIGGTGDTRTLAIAEQELATRGALDGWSQRKYYCDWYGCGMTEWCAIFVSYCARKSNIPTSIIPQDASCTSIVRYYKAQNRWFPSAAFGGTTLPVPGDIILFDWDYTGGDDADHIGYVTACDGARVYTIEGNSGNRIRKKSYSIHDRQVKGYGKPNYSAATAQPPKE